MKSDLLKELKWHVENGEWIEENGYTADKDCLRPTDNFSDSEFVVGGCIYLLPFATEVETTIVEMTKRLTYRINEFVGQLEYETIYENNIYKSSKRFSKQQQDNIGYGDDYIKKIRLNAALHLYHKLIEKTYE